MQEPRMLLLFIAALLSGLLIGIIVVQTSGDLVEKEYDEMTHRVEKTPDAVNGGYGDVVVEDDEEEETPSMSMPLLHKNVATSMAGINLRDMVMHLRNGDKYVFILGTDISYLPLAMNAMLSLRDFGLHKHVLIYCYDMESCNVLAEAGLNTVLNDYDNTVSHQFYSNVNCPHTVGNLNIHKGDGTSTLHAEVMLDRTLFHADLMNKGYSYWLFDADVCFRKNPAPLFFGDPETDIIVSAHISYRDMPEMPWFAFQYIDGMENVWVRLNNGISLARSREATRSLTARMIALMFSKLCQVGFAQGCFNKELYDEGLRLVPIGKNITVMTQADDDGEKFEMPFKNELLGYTEPYADHTAIKVRTTPFDAYYNGCERDTLAPLENATIVHANCADDKRWFLQYHGCYFLRDDFLDYPRTGDPEEWFDSIDIRNDPYYDS